MIIDYLQEGSAQSHALIRWEYDKLGKQNLLRFTLGFILEHTSITNNLVIQVAHKIVPVGVIWIDETCPVDVKLQDSLEAAIDLFEVLRVSFDFHNLESLLYHHLSFVISWLFEGQDASACIRNWHISLKIGDSLARKLEIF